MSDTQAMTGFGKAEENLINILNLAFALGLVHALDADHVIAVSALAGQPRTAQRNPRWYGLRLCLI